MNKKFTRDPKNFHGKKSPKWNPGGFVLGKIKTFSSGFTFKQGKAKIPASSAK